MFEGEGGQGGSSAVVERMGFESVNLLKRLGIAPPADHWQD